MTVLVFLYWLFLQKKVGIINKFEIYYSYIEIHDTVGACVNIQMARTIISFVYNQYNIDNFKVDRVRHFRKVC